jgi:hypothetical protein
LSFLLSSRARAAEEFARAEAREAEEAIRRAAMEEADRRRAVAANAEDGVEAEEEEGDGETEGEERTHAELEPPNAASGSPHLLGLPATAASQAAMGTSVSSIDTGVFKFELRSTAGSEQQQPMAAPTVAAEFHPPVQVYARKLDLRHGASGSASAAASSSAAPAAKAAPLVPIGGLQQLHLEPEGDCGSGSRSRRSSSTSSRASGNRIDVHLSQLPFRLVLLTFSVDHLPHCTNAILHALMHNSADACGHAASSSPAAAGATADSSSCSSGSAVIPTSLRPCFFSFTQAGSEVSLIVEEVSVREFPSSCGPQHRSLWRAIQVSQGSDAAGEAGASLVAPLSAILAQHSIPILYLSTANLDYILVAENQVDEAIQALTRDMNVLVDS